MITSISTNFGVEQITLNCYDSSKIVVLQGQFIIDTANENYQAAEQLEITFQSQFQIPSSKPTTAFLVCENEGVQSGTIVNAHIQGNKLIIEKLSIYDGRDTVKVILASGFVGESTESLLAPVKSAPISMKSTDYSAYISISRYANVIQDDWGMFYLLMSGWSFLPGVTNEYTITGLPTDICVDIPFYTSRTNNGLLGSKCVVAHFENGKISFMGPGQEGSSKQYLERANTKFFFVREPAE